MVEHERTGWVDLVTWSFSRVAMWAPAFIVLIIFYEVVLRYVFLSPTLWVNEMSLWVAGGIYLTAGLYSLQQRSHIRIFVIYDLAPRWLRRVFDSLSVLRLRLRLGGDLGRLWRGQGQVLALGDLRHRLRSADPGNHQTIDPDHTSAAGDPGNLEPDL
jgi:hypothetical protein